MKSFFLPLLLNALSVIQQIKRGDPMFPTEAQKRHKEEIVAWLTAYAEREGLTMSEMTVILDEFRSNLPLICVVKNPKTR